MNCELFQRHVGAFVDGELDAATAVEFERHLETCEPCLDHLEFEAATRDHVRESWEAPPTPEGLAERMCAALDAEDARTLLAFATRAAGLNCQRAGCQPPALREVESAG